MAKPVKDWALRIGLVLPALLLAVVAVPRFVSGLAWEAAFPVPLYTSMNVPQPPKAYRAAAKVLAHTDAGDGEAQIARAQALVLAGEPAPRILPILENGLAQDPSSSAGWTLLSEILAPTNPKRAAAALGLALELAPYDYYVAGRRARAGALLWAFLSPDDRQAVLRQTRLLWSEKGLRGEIRPLLRTQAGEALVNRAFPDDPDGLRTLNRTIARERLALPPGP